jgi:hypothetical protein
MEMRVTHSKSTCKESQQSDDSQWSLSCCSKLSCIPTGVFHERVINDREHVASQDVQRLVQPALKMHDIFQDRVTSAERYRHEVSPWPHLCLERCRALGLCTCSALNVFRKVDCPCDGRGGHYRDITRLLKPSFLYALGRLVRYSLFNEIYIRFLIYYSLD